MSVSAEQVKSLRDKTGAGIVDCRTALTETGGDVEKAVDFLRKKGLASASKKSGRTTAEGVVSSYIHAGGKNWRVVRSELRNRFRGPNRRVPIFGSRRRHAHRGFIPQFVRREDVTKELVDKEREIYRAQARELKKPEAMLDKIADGKMEKFFSDICLLEQAFVRDPDKTVGAMITEAIAKIGENISIRRFARFQLGEGIEKKSESLEEAVAKTLNS